MKSQYARPVAAWEASLKFEIFFVGLQLRYSGEFLAISIQSIFHIFCSIFAVFLQYLFVTFPHDKIIINNLWRDLCFESGFQFCLSCAATSIAF